MCSELGVGFCGRKGLKTLIESSLNLIKLGVEPRLGILSFVGGELLGQQLLQMQIDFFIYVLRLSVLIRDLVDCICFLQASRIRCFFGQYRYYGWMSLSGV